MWDKENLRWTISRKCRLDTGKKSEKKVSADKYIKDHYDSALSTNENFEQISKKIGVSKLYFSNIVYQSKLDFNTDWVHQDDQKP